MKIKIGLTNDIINKSEEKYNVGSVHNILYGCKVVVIEKLKNKMRRVKVLDDNGYECIVDTTRLRRGNLKNPYSPSVFNIGYLGVGKYGGTSDLKHSKYLTLWKDMLRRCYDTNHTEKHPTYKTVVVCKEWHCYQNFAKWCEDNYPRNIVDIKFELDKDLLQIGVENKVYSPETCIFLPHKINLFFTNRQGSKTTGERGVSFYNNKFVSRSVDFETGNIISKYNFNTLDEAIEFNNAIRFKNIEKIKKYLVSLNYLSDNVLNTINERLML